MVIWAFDPREGERDFAVWISDVGEYDFILARGFAMLDGVRAVPVIGPGTSERACGHEGESFLRLRLDEPFGLTPVLEAVA